MKFKIFNNVRLDNLSPQIVLATMVAAVVFEQEEGDWIHISTGSERRGVDHASGNSIEFRTREWDELENRDEVIARAVSRLEQRLGSQFRVTLRGQSNENIVVTYAPTNPGIAESS